MKEKVKKVLKIEIEFLRKELVLLQMSKMLNNDEKDFYSRISESMSKRLDFMEGLLSEC